MQYLELVFRVGTLRLKRKQNEVRTCTSTGMTREDREEENWKVAGLAAKCGQVTSSSRRRRRGRSKKLQK